ncbi:CDP-alcohol phosphatidyltransferase family protein [Seonamhaeicola aphaedonensis]|uniref:CDP-diacylglycerol--serine O-phosphatidyltransferase n=1 Tax=Seonamhaeicola aphaedonensis TaxID=1461338 RepID=A0A3D9HFT4_9FLAO|nr:CDP-alcohol phosphatidyltransferase family protein [Seonamhaeicola aphaedonensis]RED48343.1 CDP-diacylglycerol--serine O-phosphatidyltransferase [Seonamhaeicola aphaedonensis]
MKRYIPNALTLLNLLCGSIAVIFAVNDNFVSAAFFVFLGIFFDFFDGFAARKLNIQSEIGLQLDSLADVVTSGLVPGIIMYKLFQLVEIELGSWDNSQILFGVTPLACIGLSITLASAYRLAKFNVDTEQQNFFKGLPTPANTLLIVSLPLILEFQNNDTINAMILNKWFLIGVTILSCWLLNSGIKLFALKFKTWGFKPNATRYIFIILCVVLLIVLQFAAIPLIILLYIIMSVLDNMTSK